MMFDLQVTIDTEDVSRDGYYLNLSSNIPVEIESDKPSGYDMVLSPSGSGTKGGRDVLIITQGVR